MRLLLVLSTSATLALLAAGCGGSDDDGASAESTTPPQATTTAAPSAAPATGAVTIRMSEFAFDPKEAVVKAGKVTISAPNDGKVVHELVVLKTDAEPSALPMKGGEVDESSSVGEVADVEAGATKKTTLHLSPGTYAIVCNLPGHYKSGMYGSLTVQ
jgi:uncharacterized cupredoxin-like copper-binding protein